MVLGATVPNVGLAGTANPNGIVSPRAGRARRRQGRRSDSLTREQVQALYDATRTRNRATSGEFAPGSRLGRVMQMGRFLRSRYAPCKLIQRSRTIRRRSSTTASVPGATAPQALSSRSLEIDRTASHIAYDVSRTPPSGGSIWTWSGIPRRVVVNGTTMTKFARPRLKLSADTTKAGRIPACSCPRVGFRLTIQISPREATWIETTPLPTRQEAPHPRRTAPR